MIGFHETNYSATESSGVATLMFGLISGGVQNNVSVQLVFVEGDAQGIHVYYYAYLYLYRVLNLYTQLELTLSALEVYSHSILPVKQSIFLMCHW